MKFLLLIAGVVLFQVIGIECLWKKEITECVKEAGISEDVLKLGHEANKGKAEFKCIHACMLKKIDELEPGNKINFDKVRENVPPKFADKADDIVKAHTECAEAGKDKTDECEFANAFIDCIHSKLPGNP